MKTKILGLGLIAAFLSGCGANMSNWTARANPAEGAILFEANITDDNTSGFRVRELDMFFYKPGEDRAGHSMILGSEAWGGPVKGFSEKIFLLKLPVGLYEQVALNMAIVGNEVHWARLDKPGGAWKGFKVEPGKVTVLGSIDIGIKLRLVSNSGGTRTFSWDGSTTTWDDRLPARQAVAKAAAIRPEAVSKNWKDPIDTAIQELASSK